MVRVILKNNCGLNENIPKNRETKTYIKIRKHVMCNNESFMNTNGNNWQILHERIRDASQPNVTLWRKLFKNENLDVIHR